MENKVEARGWWMEGMRQNSRQGVDQEGLPSSCGLLPGLLAVYQKWPVWDSVLLPPLAGLRDEGLAAVLWSLLHLFGLEAHQSARGQKH